MIKKNMNDINQVYKIEKGVCYLFLHAFIKTKIYRNWEVDHTVLFTKELIQLPVRKEQSR